MIGFVWGVVATVFVLAFLIWFGSNVKTWNWRLDQSIGEEYVDEEDYF